MSGSRSTPRASIPASRSSARNSPRPQPMSSTGAGVAEVVHVGALPFADALRRARASGSRRRSSPGRRRDRSRSVETRRSGGRRAAGARSRRSSRVSRSSSSTPRARWRGRSAARRLASCCSAGRRLVPLGQRVERACSDGSVEPALVDRERLDVPAHGLAQDALERREREPAQAPARARADGETAARR